MGRLRNLRTANSPVRTNGFLTHFPWDLPGPEYGISRRRIPARPFTLTFEEPGYVLRGSRDDVSAAECQRTDAQLNTLQREVPVRDTHAL